MTSKIKKILFFFILINYISFSQSDEVKTVNYNELKPLINKSGEKTYVVNFWATWCAPCIKEIPYYEELNKNPKIDVLLVSLDFPNHIYSRLIPFIKKNKIQSEVILLNDSDENYFISEINPDWSGALPATIIYNEKKRVFFEKSFTKNELFKLVKNF
ncbi:MAG: TlpA disulfide reductase family protein [Bacteroidota bacterium]|nr:TlpA disulfide reductase family protein [Bacteroidota bacterium]